MPVTAILILLGFVYLLSTGAALLLSLMQDEDVRRRFVFVPWLNTVWIAWSLLYMVTAQGRGTAGKPPNIGSELRRAEAVRGRFIHPPPQ